MITIYCRHFHSSPGGTLCHECQSLFDYAAKRIEHCPHTTDKTSCRLCKTHCYRPVERERIREIMRYSGPRMIIYHPIAAIRHILSEMR